MKKVVVWVVLGAITIAALLSDFVQTLLFGWVGYLARILPRLAPDPPTVLVSLVAAGAFMLGVHWLGRGWMKTHGTSPAVHWKWRWSAIATLMLFVLFAASVAMVGIVHMSLWLATDPEPLRDAPVIAKAAARMKVSNNQKQLGLAFHNHHDVYGSFPAAATFAPEGRALHGWEVRTIASSLYNTRAIDMTIPWDHPKNARFFQSVLPEFINPALPGAPTEDDRGFGLNHYSANSHVFKANKSLTMAEISDGLSQTILMGEINNQFQPWGKPMNVRDPAKGINKSPRGFGGPAFAGGAQMLMADGSVRFINEKTSPEVLRALATPNGGEEIDQRALDR